MHRLLRNVCLILCWLMAIPVSAQRIISGTVFDENKEPLMGSNSLRKRKSNFGNHYGCTGKIHIEITR